MIIESLDFNKVGGMIISQKLYHFHTDMAKVLIDNLQLGQMTASIYHP